MIAYIYITTALILYPIIGRFIIRISQISLKHKKTIVWTLSIISVFIVIGMMTHIMTISENLNWFLLTTIYLTISNFLWLTQLQELTIVNKIGKALIVLIFGSGYLIATLGFFFLLIVSQEFTANQRKWLTNDLIYTERNIGQGPDPSVRLKTIEVYKKIKWLPFLTCRIKTKTYDEWNTPLQQSLDVSYHKDKQVLYLSSVINGYKVFKWSDAISLKNQCLE